MIYVSANELKEEDYRSTSQSYQDYRIHRNSNGYQMFSGNGEEYDFDKQFKSQIGKTGGQFGGSIGEGLSMGIDAITAENKHGDDFVGVSLNIGLGISSTVGEAHGLVTYTVEDWRLRGE